MKRKNAPAPKFQCSSASRKFLNNSSARSSCASVSFSALQRAENSSISEHQFRRALEQFVSVLFSEPKIPQCRRDPTPSPVPLRVSVLFSEPKIPQLLVVPRAPRGYGHGFSALQRAENSSIIPPARAAWMSARFSALQRAENSSMKIPTL